MLSLVLFAAASLLLRSALSRPHVRDSFQDFLKEAAAESEGIPTTLDQLQDAGVRLVISDKQDPDGVGFVQWRCVFKRFLCCWWWLRMQELSNCL